jgi:hypothetical protein
MRGLMKMLRGMLILRAIAAADVPARFAKTQMHPLITNLQAILAALRARRDFTHLIEMNTSRHQRSPFNSLDEQKPLMAFQLA